MPAGKTVIDLFAGTGNVGLEAMSRGADRVCFVENNPIMIKMIKRNLDKCGFTEGFDILPISMESALERLIKRGATFDIIFADPPYDQGWVEKTVRSFLKAKPLFSEETLAIIQHSHREVLPEDVKPLELIDQRKYGDTLISILKMNIKKHHSDSSD